MQPRFCSLLARLCDHWRVALRRFDAPSSSFTRASVHSRPSPFARNRPGKIFPRSPRFARAVPRENRWERRGENGRLEIYERPVLEHSKETARKPWNGARGTRIPPPSPSFFIPNLDEINRATRRSGVFNGIESSSDHLPRRTFIPGTLLKSRVSGTVSMVHDTWRELNRSRGRVITSRLERRRRRKKKKGAVCREIKKRREGKMERKRGGPL